MVAMGSRILAVCQALPVTQAILVKILGRAVPLISPALQLTLGILAKTVDRIVPLTSQVLLVIRATLVKTPNKIVSQTFQPITPLVVLLIISRCLAVSKTLRLWIINLVLIRVFLTVCLAGIQHLIRACNRDSLLQIRVRVGLIMRLSSCLGSLQVRVSPGKVFHPKTRIANCLVEIRSGAPANS